MKYNPTESDTRIKLIQGSVSKAYQETIKQDLQFFKDRWIRMDYTVKDPIITDPNIIDNGQEELPIYSQEFSIDVPQTNLFFFIKPLILTAYDRPIKSLLRCKFNRLLRNENFTINNYNIPHQDTENNGDTSMIYYVNDSDGNTVFFENNTIVNRITPKQGDIVLFPSNLWHASCNPSKNAERIVLNVVAETVSSRIG